MILNFIIINYIKLKFNNLSENFFNINNINDLDVNELYLNHNKNWLYSFSENFFSYSYDLTYNFFNSFIFQENVNLNNKIYWSKSICNIEINFIVSILLDQIYFLSLFFFPLFNEFYKHLITTFEFNNFIFNHPEYLFIYKYYIFYFYQNYFSNLYLSVYLLDLTESYLTPTMLLTQFFFIFVLILFLLTTYFNYYINYNSEESIVDHDYLIYNVTIESEEEIGSMDDMLLTSVILLYIFLWFFWIYSWSYISITPGLVMSIYLFPFIYFIIFFIPFSLLYDYGSYFLTYLNGVGKSSVLVIELLFDYIAVSIFYLRLMVQNVRLVFMLFTYSELHEMIVFYSVEENLFLGNESYISSSDKNKTNVNNNSYYLILNIPVLLLRWLYELFHTFFMVIFQFIAFFAMIFWLFLFLYTMFVLETQESFFLFKKLYIKKKFKKIINLKKN